MTKSRDSFIFYRSFYSASKCLKKDEKAELFDAICEFALENNTLNLSGTVQGMFELIKPQLQANRKKFENGCKKKQTISKTEAKRKQTISKDEANVNDNVNVNDNLNHNFNEESKSEFKSKSESKEIYSDDVEELTSGLKFVIEEKLRKKVNINTWKKEIKKLLNDLQLREYPVDDVKRAIQAVADYTGEKFFPIVQSASSLREKFTKIEGFLTRNTNSLREEELSEEDKKTLELLCRPD